MDLIEPPIALLAGVLTIASPCVLPLLPVVLGTSVERSGRLRPLFIVSGFVLAFASLGLLLGLLSHSSGHVQEAVRSASIVLLALFGLARIWPRPYDWLMARLSAPARPPEGRAASRGEDVAQRQEGTPSIAPARPPEGRAASRGEDVAQRQEGTPSIAPARPPEGRAASRGEDVAQRQEGTPSIVPARPPEGRAASRGEDVAQRQLGTSASGPLQRMASLGGTGSGNAGGFLLGVSLGAVWTPCAGPVLASILVLAARAQDIGHTSFLLLLYAVGAGIPMLAIAYGGKFVVGRVRRIARHTGALQRGFGVLLILTAVAIHFQYDVLAYAWIAGLFQ